MNGKQVLIVEDEPIIRELLSLILEDTGAIVTAVETATEGINMLKHYPWAMVITDVRTPGLLDGWDLAWAAHNQLPSLSVIVTSGGNDHFANPLPSSAAFIAKPWSVEQMLSLLQRLSAPLSIDQ